MMIHAYQEIYLNKAQALLGEAFDYAVNVEKIPGVDFVKMFTVSSLSKRIENGEPAVLLGKSGIELAADVVRETTGRELKVEPRERLGRSAEYWIGWAVAYYQWWSGRTFGALFGALTFDDLRRMYHPMHEADISKFVDVVDKRMRVYYPETNLKRLRVAFGCSQSELAKMSGVSLRSIQMYEQRNKDINKASSDAVYSIARSLGCRMEDLLEFV